MIITHGFCFSNLMYTHDSLNFYNETPGLGKVSLGRWLYPSFVHFRQIATPWMMGVFSILYVSLAVVLVTKILNFNKYQGFCVSILFTTSVSLTSLFGTYVFDGDADCMALLLACFAVYAFFYYPRIVNVVLSILSVVLCLSLYQAYICVTLGLFIMIVISKSNDSHDWKSIVTVFAFGIKVLVTVLLSVMIYIPLMNAMSKQYNVSLSMNYNGAGKLSSLTIDTVIRAIPKAYIYFENYFFKVTGYNTAEMVRIYWIVLVLIIMSIISYICSCRPFAGSLLLVFFCLIIMPLALNAIYLVSFGTMHQLMSFAFCFVFLLPFIFINCSIKHTDKKRGGIQKYVSILTLTAILFIGIYNAIYANGAYVYKKLVYDNTVLHAQMIWKDINSLEDYVEGEHQIVFMGDFDSSKLAYNSPVGDRYYYALNGACNSAITYPGTAHRFYLGILGREMDITHDDPEIMQNDEYKNMPVYPKMGYCKIIDNKVVVKIN